MPRDTNVIESFDTVPIVDPLTRMGITPIPRSVVDDYKEKYRLAWIAENANGRPLDQFKWKRAYHVRGTSLAKFLSNWGSTARHAVDASPAPTPLVRLALQVQRAVPGAKFSLQYFDRDPVLDVDYNSVAGDQSRWPNTACLGIWNPEVRKRGGLIAIAEGAPKDWWDRIVEFWRA